mmetsp:Transcript_47338/g.148338  ORF Transcript_47338/g.148338 Transcript_47338/m.148338 type:complete len:246 (-) Transcript_47338:446-1183(-)
MRCSLSLPKWPETKGSSDISLLVRKVFVLNIGSWKAPLISASSARSSCRQAAAAVMAAQRAQPQKGHSGPPLLKENMATMPLTAIYNIRLNTARYRLLSPPKPMKSSASKELARAPATAPLPLVPRRMTALVAQSRCGLGRTAGGVAPVAPHRRLKATHDPVATRKPPTSGMRVFKKTWRQTVKTMHPEAPPSEYQSTARPCTVWSPARAQPPRPCAPRRPRDTPKSTWDPSKPKCVAIAMAIPT